MPLISKLVLASGNRHKIHEISELFKASGLPLSVVPITDFDPTFNPDESGATLAENAAIKARAAAQIIKLPCLADDTGLFVDCLDGAPGVHAARYAGLGKSFGDNNRKLLEAMAPYKGNQRKARFVCHLCLVLEDGRQIDVEEAIEGLIADSMSGAHGFGYDPVFMMDGKALAEMSIDEKNRVSHRAKAVRTIVAKL